MILSRRKFLVFGLSAGCAAGAGPRAARWPTEDAAWVWQGAALGGEARVTLYGTDHEIARHAAGAVASEIERLEEIFSLYRSSSQLSRLNRDRSIVAPSVDLVGLLRAARDWRHRTEGVFDPTVQPIWQAMATGRPVTPELLGIAGAPIEVRSDRVSLRPGTQLTLNGIAQGRIADRIAEILRSYGYTDVVIDAGELRLPGATRRSVRVPAARIAVQVAEVAIATSEPGSLVFDASSRRHHLIDPRSGDCPDYWRSVTVFAPTAETADALSTAFAVMPQDAVADLSATLDDVAVIGTQVDGRVRRFGDQRQTGT